jgi:hypothetical protein
MPQILHSLTCRFININQIVSAVQTFVVGGSPFLRICLYRIKRAIFGVGCSSPA